MPGSSWPFMLKRTLYFNWLSLAVGILLTVSLRSAYAQAPAIKPDIVYGHKDGLALTFDWYSPTEKANGAAVVFIVSGG